MTVQQALDDPATSQYAPRSSESVAAPGSDYNISNYYPPTTTGSHPTTDHDLAARAAVSAQTELGSPQNRIPTREDTQRQLAAIQASELPVGASRTSAEGGVFPPSSDIGYDTYRDGDYNGHVKSSNKAYTNVRCQTEKEDDGMVSASLRQHRKSNYAPGYKAAGEAVPERSYIAEGHNAVSFPHEQLFGSEQQQGTGAVGGGTTTTADQGRDVPPPLPPRTHGIDYASSSGNPTTYGAATAGAGTGNSHANTGRNSPGASLGSKVQGVLAQVHVSEHGPLSISSGPGILNVE